MREMVFKTPSRTLRDLHRDVWRLAHAPADRGNGNRSFLFRPYPDGTVLVQGPHLPARHSASAAPLAVGETRAFDLLVRAVRRRDDPLRRRFERPVEPEALGDWLSARLDGMALLNWQAEHQAFAMDDTHTLAAYRLVGRLRIVDAMAASIAISRGIGRTKGFGFGLLILSDPLESTTPP